MSEVLLRYTLDISNIEEININIEAYKKVIGGYEEYMKREGEDEYIQSRINYLNNILCEYLIARQFALEGVRTYGEEE